MALVCNIRPQLCRIHSFFTSNLKISAQSCLLDYVMECCSLAAPNESIPCSNDFGTLTLRRGIRDFLILQSHYPQAVLDIRGWGWRSLRLKSCAIQVGSITENSWPHIKRWCRQPAKSHKIPMVQKHLPWSLLFSFFLIYSIVFYFLLLSFTVYFHLPLGLTCSLISKNSQFSNLPGQRLVDLPHVSSQLLLSA